MQILESSASQTNKLCPMQFMKCSDNELNRLFVMQSFKTSDIENDIASNATGALSNMMSQTFKQKGLSQFDVTLIANHGKIAV